MARKLPEEWTNSEIQRREKLDLAIIITCFVIFVMAAITGFVTWAINIARFINPP